MISAPDWPRRQTVG